MKHAKLLTGLVAAIVLGLAATVSAQAKMDHKSCTGADGSGWCSRAGFGTVDCGHDVNPLDDCTG